MEIPFLAPMPSITSLYFLVITAFTIIDADNCEMTSMEEFITITVNTVGIGNVLPSIQKIILVSERPKGKNAVFLPFEGDATLSIILSKAFFLAEDKKITDTTILNQIKRG